MRAITGKAFTNDYSPTCSPLYAVCSVDYQGMEKYLVFIEAGPNNGSLEALIEQGDALCCDLILFCFDGSDPHSFTHLPVYRERLAWSKQTPCLLVECKADRTTATPPHAAAWATQEGLPILRISVGRNEEEEEEDGNDNVEADDEDHLLKEQASANIDDLVQMSVAVAMNPLEKIPSLRTAPANLWPWALAISIPTLVIGGIILHRYLKQ